ncbi:MAG: hypothetical protein ACFE85_03280 [Candidatus Hodarchaeota archaeon]
MHINSHFAVGVIISSILHYFYSFILIEFLLIIFSSFICDFDVFFSKYAINNNHRMLISHSIVPSIIIMIFGFIFNWIALFFSGFVYFIHIVIDTFDWGTNFFYFQKKQVGLKLLISREEFENIGEYLKKYKRAESFFDVKYYQNRVCMGIEVLLFILMMVCAIFFAFKFILIVLFYFPFLYFHLQRHYYLKKIEAS